MSNHHRGAPGAAATLTAEHLALLPPDERAAEIRVLEKARRAVHQLATGDPTDILDALGLVNITADQQPADDEEEDDDRPDTGNPYTDLATAIHMDPWATRADCKGQWNILECRDSLPDGRRDENQARKLCANCPVRSECRDWALGLGQREDPDDLWILGGLNRTQRNAERRRRARQRPATLTEKPCTKCGDIKPASEFYPDRNRSDGLAAKCKTCRRKSNRASAAARRAAELADRNRLPLKRTA